MQSPFYQQEGSAYPVFLAPQVPYHPTIGQPLNGKTNVGPASPTLFMPAPPPPNSFHSQPPPGSFGQQRDTLKSGTNVSFHQEHSPANVLSFQNCYYSVKQKGEEKLILKGISGTVKAGEVMAIHGWVSFQHNHEMPFSRVLGCAVCGCCVDAVWCVLSF